MAKNIVTGIDIGTHSIKIIISQNQTHGAPLILGTAKVPTRGLRNGYITNSKDVLRSLKQAVYKAEQMANVEIDSAYVSIGGVGLSAVYSQAAISIPSAESRVTEKDVNAAISKAKASAKKDLVNRTVLHTIPLRFTVDKEEVLGDPIGFKGSKLSVSIMLISVLEPHYRLLKDVIEELDIEVLGILAAPIAASLVVLTQDQKEAGCMLANIGAETVSVAVFEDGIPISMQVFPVGSSNITNDIALKLQVPLNKAEQMKRGDLYDLDLPHKKLDDIIQARLKEMFSIIKGHLKELGKDGLLPAGIILTGGGVGLAKVDEMAKGVFKLPSELARLKVPNKTLKDSTWAVAYGLCIYGAGEKDGGRQIIPFKFKNFLSSIFKHFIP